jgi:hypothetical protein
MDLFVFLSSKMMIGITSAMAGITMAMPSAMAANRMVGRDGCLTLGRT